MKKIFILIALSGLYISVTAQLVTTTVNYLKIDRDAITNEFPFSEKTIMHAIDERMLQLGYKGKDSKDFTVYKAVILPELGSAKYDLYFLADRKSRRDKENATVTLMISKGADNFATLISDAALFDKAKQYLQSMLPIITAYDLELQIVDQQDAVNNADKKYNNLIDEGQSLEKKRKNIEKDIEDNKKNQENQAIEIEKQKQKLESLKGSRRQ